MAVAEKVETVLHDVISQLGPTVKDIRYELHNDWSGDPALFLQIVLPDESTKGKDFGKLVNRVGKFVFDQFVFADIDDRFPYIRFISESEAREESGKKTKSHR